MRKSVKEFVVEYGAIGLTVYLTTTALVYVGFWLALQFGWRPSGAVGNAGYWITAYAAAKVTQPFRIIGSAAITPFIARIYERITGRTTRRSGQTPRPDEVRTIEGVND
ncbi:MAG: hypothetical protein ACREOK_08170 [Gemmatimonadaceae bacterium]